MRVLLTGASGWIGSAVVPELIAAGHQVVGLARSEVSADALRDAGAEVRRGDLDDLDGLRTGAAEADGVVHLAFRHDLAFSGDFPGAVAADRAAIEAIAAGLEGSGKPFVIASGVLGLAPGRLATEADGQVSGSPDEGDEGVLAAAGGRLANAQLVVSLAGRGIRSSVVRLPPTVHGDGDNGFLAALVAIAREQHAAGYVGDGTNRWPATHRSDAARILRLALEDAPAGSTLHAVAEERVALGEVAAVLADQLGLPTVSVAPDLAGAHFSWLGGFVSLDSPASSTVTRELLGWQPTGPGLLEDLGQGHYVTASPTA